MKDEEYYDGHGFLIDDRSPHTKPNMMSVIGRFVDRTTYTDFIIIACIVVVVCSTYFWMAPKGAGLNIDSTGIAEAVYFSVVTFTSLGYGDLSPIGLGRFIALVNVLAGLALTALVIGKIASERQASILFLLHTSDTQRRIAAFSTEVVSARSEITRSREVMNPHDLLNALDGHLRLSKAIGNYLVFNSHQAGVVQFGNFTALSGLYDEIAQNFQVLQTLLREPGEYSGAAVMRLCLANMKRMQRVATRMARIHRHAKRPSSLLQTALCALRLKKPSKPDTSELAALNRIDALVRLADEGVRAGSDWVEKGCHPIQLERIYAAFPDGEIWPTGITKQVARKLGISNSVATRCVGLLIERKRFPKEAMPKGAAANGRYSG